MNIRTVRGYAHLSQLPFSDRRIIKGLRQRYYWRVAKIKKAYRVVQRADYKRRNPFVVLEE